MREKMISIFEEMADITLENLKKNKEAGTILDETDLQMVSATLQFYNFIADNHQQTELFPQ